MTNVRNNYEDLIPPRCKKEIDDEKHLFTKCEKLADIQNKHDINDPNEVFNEGLSKERMIKIAKFIDETEIKNKIQIKHLMRNVSEWLDTHLAENAA